MGTTGLLLAAGAGTRMGRPKALVRDPDGRPWLDRAAQVLLDGGCSRVLVVLGARAEEARGLVPTGLPVDVVVAEDWADGLSASLGAGLARLDDDAAGTTAALVLLVDLPDLVPAVVARLLEDAHAGPATLARASYDGEPGHPVLLGRAHWAGVTATSAGDAGARAYLRARAGEVRLVECGDLATGADQDHPAAT